MTIYATLADVDELSTVGRLLRLVERRTERFSRRRRSVS